MFPCCISKCAVLDIDIYIAEYINFVRKSACFFLFVYRNAHTILHLMMEVNKLSIEEKVCYYAI